VEESRPDLERLLINMDGASVLGALLAVNRAAVIFADATRAVVWLSDTAADLLGYSAHELCGRQLTDCCAVPFDPAEFARTSSPSSFPVAFTTACGDVRTLATTVMPVRDAAGGEGVLLFLHGERSASPASERHHRLINNLTMACALLELEMRHAPAEMHARLMTNLARIRSMVLLQGLYDDDHPSTVEVGILARAMLNNAFSLFGLAGRCEAAPCAAPIMINARQGAYLALALTEIGVQVACQVGSHTKAVPMFTVTREDGVLSCRLTVCEDAASAERRMFDVQSLENLAILVERSLGGEIVFPGEGRGDITLRVPLECA
jgi:two-component sensor histidine kinase